MARIQAYCGLDCGECEAYVATQKNDRAGLDEVAKKWAAQFGGKDMGGEVCVCDGCSSGQRISTAHAATCGIRALRVRPRRRHLRPLRRLRLRHAAAVLRLRPRPQREARGDPQGDREVTLWTPSVSTAW